jgi:membrane protease YdiL (CAAX protease family)
MDFRNYLRQAHPFNQLVFIAIVAFASLIATFIAGMLVAVPLFGSSALLDIMNGNIFLSSDKTNLLKYFQFVQSFGLFVVPSFIIAYFLGDNVGRYLKFDIAPKAYRILMAILLVWASSPLINVMGNLNAAMELPYWLSGIEDWMRTKELEAEELTNMLLETASAKDLFINIMLIGMVPALGEELLFRGVIQQVLTRWTRSHHWGIWATAILFSALHIQFYGFIPRLFLGVLFGYIFVWSGNLWLPIIAHFTNNATAVVAYYLYDKQIITVDPDQMGAQSGFGLALIGSIVLVSLLTYLLWKSRRYKDSERYHRL